MHLKYMSTLSIFSITFIISLHTVYGDDDYSKGLADIFGVNDSKIPSLNLVHRGSKSYFIGDIFKGNFLLGQQFCRYHGMNLVTIESQEENDFIQQKIIESGNSNSLFFTSGTRIPDNRWIWLTTGTPVIYTNWNPGEPQEKQCVVAKTDNNQMKWYGNSCWASLYFICEVTWSKTERKLLDELNKRTKCDNKPPKPDIRFFKHTDGS